MIRFAILLSLLVYGWPSRAQLPRYHVQVFGPEQGIGGGGIADIFKDHQQFLWVVNTATLQRFDGRHVRTYPFEKTIEQALCDRDNRIWVLSGRKVWRSLKNREGFEYIPQDIPAWRPCAIFQVDEWPVCILGTDGIYAWHDSQGCFEKLSLSPPAPSPYTSLRWFDQAGSAIFYTADNSLISYDLLTDQHCILPVGSEIAYMHAFSPGLLAMTYYDLSTYWYDFETGKITQIEPGKSGIPDRQKALCITGVAETGSGQYLVTTRYGVFHYDSTLDRFDPVRFYAGGKPLELEEMLERIFLDDQGILWAHNTNGVVAAASIDQGLGLIRNHRYEQPGMWNNRVFNMTEDDQGNLWFCGAYGFGKLDMQRGNVKVFPPVEGARDRLSHNSVRGIVFDGRYIVLGPTNLGLWLFDPVTEAFRRPVYASETVREASEAEFVDHIALLENGDMIICGRFHPYKLSAGTYLLDFISFPGDDANTNVAISDDQKRLWIGTNNGIFVLDSSHVLRHTIPGQHINCLLQTGPGVFLAGTTRGLLQIREQGRLFHTSPVLPTLGNTGVTFIHRDPTGRYWLGTTDGLYLADIGLGSYRRFDFSDNIQSLVYNNTACFRTKEGLTFFGGINGMNYLYPEKISLEDKALTVGLQSYRTGNSDTIRWLQPGAELHFSYDNNTITFEALAPYYNNAGKIQYRYRLSGMSEDWINLGANNQIRLSGLPPGRYQLSAGASATGRRWYETAHPVVFYIAPPFWQTWAFRITATLLTGLLLWGSLRLRDTRIRKKQRAQLELERLKNTNLQYQLETEQVINYFSRTMSDKNTVDETLWNIARECIAYLKWEECVIYQVDRERAMLVQKAAWGAKSTEDGQIVNPMEVPVGSGIVGSVAATGRAELIGDTSADSRYIIDDARRASELAVPILVGGEVFGVIDSENSRRDFFTSWHLQLLTAIAALCGNKIALARTEEERRHALLQAIDNQRKTAEAKLQSMRLQMNPHFLFNALNSIQQMTISGNSDGAALYLSKFSRLLRMILAQSDRELVSLRDEIDTLQLYLELEALRFDDTFAYTIYCAEDIDKDEYRVPTLLIQPFVENAIWHGLLQKEGSRRLHISFHTAPDDLLVCMIEDNGIGRIAAGAFSANSRQQHGGRGVRVSHERIAALNSLYGQQHILEIEDLYAPDGSAMGTRVRLTIS